MSVGESDSLAQLVGSAPQQAGRASTVEEVAKARLTSLQGPRNHVVNHLSPSALCWVEGAHLLPPWTGGHQTLMGTLLQVRPWAHSEDTGAIKEVGRRCGWHLQDWICRSLSQLIQGLR